jgi:hypothetical protein
MYSSATIFANRTRSINRGLRAARHRGGRRSVASIRSCTLARQFLEMKITDTTAGGCALRASAVGSNAFPSSTSFWRGVASSTASRRLSGRFRTYPVTKIFSVLFSFSFFLAKPNTRESGIILLLSLSANLAMKQARHRIRSHHVGRVTLKPWSPTSLGPLTKTVSLSLTLK